MTPLRVLFVSLAGSLVLAATPLTAAAQDWRCQATER
jgi:hypothetical protein